MRTPQKTPPAGTGGRAMRPPAKRNLSGSFSAGLWNENHAALLGRITAALPQVDELMIEATARLLGDPAMPARSIFRGLAGDAQRIEVLRALFESRGFGAAEGRAFEAAISGYAAARRKWQVYIQGLWYTHENGRTFLAAPAKDDASRFLVAREVKAAELEADLSRLDELTAALLRLTRPKVRTRTETPRPTSRRRPRTSEPGKAKRPAPKREPGTRRRPAHPPAVQASEVP